MGFGRLPPATTEAVRRSLATEAFSYDVGILDGAVPAGMTEDVLEVPLGSGADVWKLARRAIDEWRHFDLGWVRVVTGGLAPYGSQDVVVIASRYGVNISACCRVIAVHDFIDAGVAIHGFTYGTLSDHPERGEERFDVRMLPTGEVRYRIHAMAAPARWQSRLGRPIVEHFRRQFRHDSAAAMSRAVTMRG